MNTETLDLVGKLVEYGFIGIALAISLTFNFRQYNLINKLRDAKEVDIAKLNEKFQEELLSYLEKQLASHSSTRESILKISANVDKNKTDLILKISEILRIEHDQLKLIINQIKSNNNV